VRAKSAVRCAMVDLLAGCQPQGLAASLLSHLWLDASRKVWQPAC